MGPKSANKIIILNINIIILDQYLYSLRHAQMGSVWSPHYANTKKKEKDIREINQLNKYKNGNCLMFKTISYLSDRARSLYYWDLLDLKFRYKS